MLLQLSLTSVILALLVMPAVSGTAALVFGPAALLSLTLFAVACVLS